MSNLRKLSELAFAQGERIKELKVSLDASEEQFQKQVVCVATEIDTRLIAEKQRDVWADMFREAALDRDNANRVLQSVEQEQWGLEQQIEYYRTHFLDAEEQLIAAEELNDDQGHRLGRLLESATMVNTKLEKLQIYNSKLTQDWNDQVIHSSKVNDELCALREENNFNAEHNLDLKRQNRELAKDALFQQKRADAAESEIGVHLSRITYLLENPPYQPKYPRGAGPY
jgi:hypothetical protein